VGAKLSAEPLTTAGVAPRVRSPPRWLLKTFSAPNEAAVSGWLKLTVTGLVRAATKALAIGMTEVMTGA
jgi:hypothetical protein